MVYDIFILGYPYAFLHSQSKTAKWLTIELDFSLMMSSYFIKMIMNSDIFFIVVNLLACLKPITHVILSNI